MGSEAADYGWEDIYRLYGVCKDIIDDAQPSLGENGSCPAPLTNIYSSAWF
ncbi:MAG: hypothetical protein QW520_00600 [Methanomassiliicoccales archaeon]